jgi:hypothetical protein
MGSQPFLQSVGHPEISWGQIGLPKLGIRARPTVCMISWGVVGQIYRSAQSWDPSSILRYPRTDRTGIPTSPVVWNILGCPRLLGPRYPELSQTFIVIRLTCSIQIL